MSEATLSFGIVLKDSRSINFLFLNFCLFTVWLSLFEKKNTYILFKGIIGDYRRSYFQHFRQRCGSKSFPTWPRRRRCGGWICAKFVEENIRQAQKTIDWFRWFEFIQIFTKAKWWLWSLWGYVQTPYPPRWAITLCTNANNCTCRYTFFHKFQHTFELEDFVAFVFWGFLL